MTVSPFQVPDRFNAASFFVDRHVEEGRGERVAFHYEDARITYGALQELVNRTGNALLDLGVEREQRVLGLLLDSPEFLGTFWGAIKMGAVPVPLNTMMRPPDYLYFLNDSRARVLVVSEPLLSVVEPILGEARYLRHVIVAGKQPSPQWLGMDAAIHHCTAGIGIWKWAGNDEGAEPDVVWRARGTCRRW